MLGLLFLPLVFAAEWQPVKNLFVRPSWYHHGGCFSPARTRYVTLSNKNGKAMTLICHKTKSNSNTNGLGHWSLNHLFTDCIAKSKSSDTSGLFNLIALIIACWLIPQILGPIWLQLRAFHVWKVFFGPPHAIYLFDILKVMKLFKFLWLGVIPPFKDIYVSIWHLLTSLMVEWPLLSVIEGNLANILVPSKWHYNRLWKVILPD